MASKAAGTGEAGGRAYVWDIPTRIFHWLLVGLLAFSWWSAENYRMDLHYYSGLTICGLVLFRLLWGLFGTSTSRFGQFVTGPKQVWRYLRPEEGAPRVARIGHNPLGGWSVVAMLLLLAVQVVSGLFAVDIDGIESGPLSYLISFDQGRVAAAAHEISFTVLQLLVLLHVAAVLFYLLFRRNNLIGPMITGYRIGEASAEEARKVPAWRLLPVIIVAAAITYAVSKGFMFE